jgi:hypothetical protein
LVEVVVEAEGRHLALVELAGLLVVTAAGVEEVQVV